MPPPASTHAKPTGKVCVGNLSVGRKSSGPPPQGFSDVCIDRSSKLGNPFPMGKVPNSRFPMGFDLLDIRDAVCDACEDLFEAPDQAELHKIASTRNLRVDSRFGEHPAMRDCGAALDELEGRLRAGESLRLMCWCAPARCHGDGIARLLENRIGSPAKLASSCTTVTTATPSPTPPPPPTTPLTTAPPATQPLTTASPIAPITSAIAPMDATAAVTSDTQPLVPTTSPLTTTSPAAAPPTNPPPAAQPPAAPAPPAAAAPLSLLANDAEWPALPTTPVDALIAAAVTDSNDTQPSVPPVRSPATSSPRDGPTKTMFGQADQTASFNTLKAYLTTHNLQVDARLALANGIGQCPGCDKLYATVGSKPSLLQHIMTNDTCRSCCPEPTAFVRAMQLQAPVNSAAYYYNTSRSSLLPRSARHLDIGDSTDDHLSAEAASEAIELSFISNTNSYDFAWLDNITPATVHFMEKRVTRLPPKQLSLLYSQAVKLGWLLLESDPTGVSADRAWAYINATRFVINTIHPDESKPSIGELARRMRAIASGHLQEEVTRRLEEMEFAIETAKSKADRSYAPVDHDPEAEPAAPFLATQSKAAKSKISARIQTAVAAGNYSKAYNATGDNPFANATLQSVQRAFAKLNPNGPLPADYIMKDEPGVEPFRLQREFYDKWMEHPPRDRGMGLSGSSFEELALWSRHGLANAIFQAASDFLEGRTSAKFCEWNTTSKGLPLIKDHATQALRPILCGEAFIRAALTMRDGQMSDSFNVTFTETIFKLEQVAPPAVQISPFMTNDYVMGKISNKDDEAAIQSATEAGMAAIPPESDSQHYAIIAASHAASATISNSAPGLRPPAGSNRRSHRCTHVLLRVQPGVRSWHSQHYEGPRLCVHCRGHSNRGGRNIKPGCPRQTEPPDPNSCSNDGCPAHARPITLLPSTLLAHHYPHR